MNNKTSSMSIAFSPQPDFSYHQKSSIPYEDLLSPERKKCEDKQTRSRSIILMDYQDKKQRLLLEKKLDKKQ
jgi:hypothetical protein